MNPLEMMGNGNVSMEGLLEQIKDPQTKMLAQLLVKQKNQSESYPAEQGNAPGHTTAQIRQEDMRKLIKMNRELIAALKSLTKEHEQLKKLNKTVAEAMGACECWGQDAGCAICNGNGKPGHLPINEASFTKFVQPFFEMLINQTDTHQNDPS